MNQKRFYFILSFALALCVCNFPAGASTVLFSDLGTGNNLYDQHEEYDVSGSGFALGALAVASQFTPSGVGSFSVSEIDLAVEGLGLGSVYAFSTSIWTDVEGNPGTQLSGAYWDGSAPIFPGGLVSITGITGVTLTGGQAYFLVVGPSNADTLVGLPFNSLGVAGDVQYSTNGDLTWTDGGTSSIGAFDILGAPEPTSMPLLLFGVGLVGIFAAYRCRSQRLMSENV